MAFHSKQGSKGKQQCPPLPGYPSPTSGVTDLLWTFQKLTGHHGIQKASATQTRAEAFGTEKDRHTAKPISRRGINVVNLMTNMLQIFSLSLWWWIQHVTSRLWVQSPYRPFTKELDLTIFVGPFQLTIRCESVKIDVTEYLLCWLSDMIYIFGVELFSIWLCVQRERFSTQHIHMFTKPEQNRMQVWSLPRLMSSPQNPTTPHRQPLAQLIGLLSGHTFHGVENKHRWSWTWTDPQVTSQHHRKPRSTISSTPGSPQIWADSSPWLEVESWI